MKKIPLFAVLILFVLMNSSIFLMFTSQVQAQTDLYSLPSGAKMVGNELDTETILLSISQQVVSASPGETITLTATYQIWSSGGPGIIKQAFFVVSWTPSWPPPSGYYISLYNGEPGYYPGVTETKSFSITVPSTNGTYYLWFGVGASYSMEDAVNRYTNPPSLPAHAKILVGATLTLTPSSGFATTTLVGSGFQRISWVFITWDGTNVSTVPSPLITDSNGDFTAIISILTQNSPGLHTVKATDESGNWATATFTVVDMTGPIGPQGPQGPQGQQGPSGAAGIMSGELYIVNGLTIVASIIAICLATVALFRKKP